MPVCQRFYPVEADAAPPADFDALARWMERWGLLPADMPRVVAQHHLEALTSRPVETVEAEGMPDTTTSQILRLPAEWEPSEAVVITWPVLYPGLWGFWVDVLIPHRRNSHKYQDKYFNSGTAEMRRIRMAATL